ncbi:sister chromatid cohesion 1 protein 4 isoform X2 [Silene latifolia]|uniref:sister chromatid cohesion 1 protein 4 isoform X2 n=1 Tax=Silene latifolia TaxID=37657 RepID=UPI003D770089
MFYSQFILAKKGPLGTIWIAAHLERKLRKNQVADTDIGVSVDSILCPDVPIALRLSSHLLLGVVRIYSRKVNYLFDDCSDALLKVKQAFRSTAVDLPPEQSKAPYHSITLPETFDLDDFELPDNEIFQGNDRHVSTREQITLQDTMDGVAFQTSQFGLDERFGDGDASQIGLDLDEDLFLEKGDAAGTSDALNNTGADQSSAKEATSFKDDEHSERASDLALNASTNYFNIQAPSTPGLMEEPNLPSPQEALASDDHMDEDQNISELAAKEVSGTASSQVEPSYVHSLGLNSDGNLHQLDEQENEHVMSETSLPPNEAVETTPVGDAQPFKSIEHIDETHDVDSSGNKLEYIPLLNEAVMAVDSQSVRRDYDQDEADLNMGGNVILAEVHDQDTCVDVGKADRNGSYIPDSGIHSENMNFVVAEEVFSAEENETVTLNDGYQCQKSDQPCQNLENFNISENNGIEKLSVFSTQVLKPCNSHHHNICEVEELADVSRLSAETDGFCSMGLTSAPDNNNFTEISAVVQGTDSMMPTSKVDWMAHEGSDAITSTLDRPLDSDRLRDDYFATQNNSKASDFSAPEKLLSMPSPAVGQPDNLAECTPGVEVVARDGDCIEAVEGDGDASFETSLSGKKRSYTESTLTMQSLNSAASSNADQSKQSVELVPKDDDLLSSILGGRSTAFKLKPTPPVSDRLPAKRQRSSVRPSALKRKVLLDDSMVLHGDMIREQLTNTEDIRRVRKKAPCTRLEVWVLQKQFLEDGVFSEPLFTGLLPEFRCMHSQPRDLSGIIIVQDGGSKGTIESDPSSRLMYAAVETESMMPSGAVDKGKQEHEVDALQKELETFDNEVAKQMSKPDVSGKKVEMEICDQAGGEGNQLVASTAEPTSLVTLVPEVACTLNNLKDNAEVDVPYINEIAEVVVSEDIDASRPPINQDNQTEFTWKDVSTMEKVSESGREDQKVDINVNEKSIDESLLEKVSVDTDAVMEDVQGTCSSAIQDIPVAGALNLEGEGSPKADKIIEEFHLGECRLENEEEVNVSDIRHDDCCPMPNNFLEEDVKIDHSRILENDLSSHEIQLSGKEDLQFLETDPTLMTDPATVPSEFINPADISDFGTEVIEHDTDFLNVDDDNVDEDYEDDTINPEEKRMLDNSGWSSRTRAVANYLQVLFEKETQHAKMVIPLESLLVGKTRKEASRMFFETLVLKTKDYIDAKQDDSFCDIKIKPTGKLLKSEF